MRSRVPDGHACTTGRVPGGGARVGLVVAAAAVVGEWVAGCARLCAFVRLRVLPGPAPTGLGFAIEVELLGGEERQAVAAHNQREERRPCGPSRRPVERGTVRVGARGAEERCKDGAVYE